MRSHLRFAVVATMLASPLATGQSVVAEDALGGTSEVSTAAPQDVVLEALKQYPPLTVDEAATFAEELEIVMCLPNAEDGGGFVDWDLFLELCFTDIAISGDWKEEFRRLMIESLRSEDGFFADVRRSLGDDGTYELVRVHEVDGRQRALFRMSNGDCSFNYHDYILTRDDAGRPRAIDIHVYGSGEPLSMGIRETIRELATEQKQGIFGLLFGSPEDKRENKRVLNQMIQHNRERQHAETLQTYAAAPESVKLDKYALIQRYIAAMNIEDTAVSFPEIQATVDLYRQTYPQDAAIDFLSVGDHISREEYDLALQAVDRIDRIIGGDAYLHEVRGDILYLADENDKARAQYELAIAALPHRDSAYFGVITIALDAQDHATTLAELKRLDQAMELEWCDLNDVPAYADFVASEYHARWLEYLRSKAVLH